MRKIDPGKKIISAMLALVMLLSLCTPALGVEAGEGGTPSVKNLAEYPDLLFGVGSATAPGPSLPGGSIHPSPETKEKDTGGYSRNQPIMGFGQIYAQGTGGTKSYGNFLLTPEVDGVKLKHDDKASNAVQGTETAKCYEYSVELANGIKAKVTPAQNSAIYSFEYPAGKDPSFVIDAARKMNGSLRTGSVTVDPETNTISGGGNFDGNWNEQAWDMFFALQFDTDYLEMGTFTGDTQAKCETKTTVPTTNSKQFGAYVKFAKSETAPVTVKVKIAISFVSEEKAKEFLNDQIPAYDYDAVRDAAKATWEDKLDAIEIETTDEALLRQFYTALYHTNVEPRDRVSDHGDWDDFYTIWDSWKTAFPLKTFFYPEQVGEIIASFIDRAERNDKIIMSDAFIQGKEYVCGQGGNDIENIIADACLKDIPLPEGYTWERAYEAVKKSATLMRTKEYVEKGYVSTATDKKTVSGAAYSSRLRPGSATQGFALNDFAVAQMAKKLGHTEDYKFYLARSKSWKNAWNPDVESEGFYGFPQNPNSDGTYAAGYNPHGGANSHFYEATGWDSSFTNRNDMAGLIEAMGGRQEFIKRLQWACDHSVNYQNDSWSEGYLNFTNEPSMHIPWLFCADEIKRPDLASHTVNRILTERFLKDGINDYPGDEDGGAMSSYFIFMMSGFFPNSTTNDYFLHGARLPKITFRLAGEKEFIITGDNTGDDNIYVQSATWQGQPLNECKLTYEQIMEGGELHFVMGSEPSDWARIVDNDAPTAVTDLTYDAESAANGQTVLTWNAATDAGEGVARYDIYRGDESGFTCDENTLVGTTIRTTFTETPEVPTRYWYKVIAVDGADNKSDAAEARVTLKYDSEAPGKVTGLQAEDASLESGIVKLSWTEADDNVGVTSYNVYRSGTPDFAVSADTLRFSVEGTAVTDVVPVGTYYYRITARDAQGNISEPSECLTVVTTGALPADTVATPNVNHAKGKTAKESGKTNDNESGPKAVDGSSGTKWCVKSTGSNGGTAEVPAGTPLQNPHWLEIDLGKPTLLNRWVVTHAGAGTASGGAESTDYNTQDFKLMYWDGAAWADADVVAGNKASVTDRTFSAVITTKVRMEITKAVQDVFTGSGNAKQTARVYEVALYSPELESEYKGSLTMGGDVQFTANGWNTAAEQPQYACDGNPATKWSVRVTTTGNKNQEGEPDMNVAQPGGGTFTNGSSWMTVDLGEMYKVDRILYQGSTENAAHRTQEMYLQTSVDGENWVYTDGGVWKDGTSNAIPSTNKVDQNFTTPITSRYFRLLLPAWTANDGNCNARVSEFHLFGEKVDNKNAITVAPADGATVTASAVSAAPGDKVNVTVEYTKTDREFVKLLVTGESGTPAAVAREDSTLNFSFTMPNEPVEIRLNSRLIVDTDAEGLAAALAAVVDGTITVTDGTNTAAVLTAVQAYVDGRLAKFPDAAGVTANVTATADPEVFKVDLVSGAQSDAKNINMTIQLAPYKILSAAAVPGVNAVYGTAKADVIKTLPEKVEFTFTKGEKRDLTVTWDCAAYSETATGELTFIGTPAEGTDYINPNTVTAACTVSVRGHAMLQSIDFTKDGLTKADIKAAWDMIREDSATWELESGKGLTIHSERGDLNGNANNVKNMFYQEAPGDWTVETAIELDGLLTQNFQQAGLFVYQDDDNYVKLWYQGNATESSRKVAISSEIDGVFDSHYDLVAYNETKVWFRLQKAGDTYTAWYSADGENYTPLGERTVELADDMRLVLAAANGSQDASSVAATFEYVKVLVPVAAVTLNKDAATLTVGGTETLTATVTPNNATDKSVTWASNEPQIATVDANGVVTAVSEGTATITATTTDGGKTATCIVTVTEAAPPETYTVTVTGGTITSPDASGSYEAGTEISVTANAPETGYQFKSWTATGLTGATITANPLTFTMPVNDVALTATYEKTADQLAVETAKSLVEGKTYTVAQATANTEGEVAAWLDTTIAALSGMSATGVAAEVEVTDFTAATEGGSATPAGENGSFTFNVTLRKNDSSIVLEDLEGAITATAYVKPGVTAAPAFETAAAAFASADASTVAFVLIGDPVAVYKVYDAETEGKELTDPSAGVDGSILTLTFTAQPDGEKTYYISATDAEGGLTESTRTEVTVMPYTAPDVPVDRVTIDPAAKTMTVGDTFRLTASVEPENATDKSIVWTSDKPEIATVDEDGMVKALGEGTAVITAQAGGMTAACTIRVEEEPEEPSYTPPSNTTTKTEKNEDGSTTKTVTNKKTGGVTATTTYPDGTKIVATTPKDGETSIEVTVPKDKETVVVTIPTAAEPKPGEVAVIIKEDGTKEILKTSVATENGMKVLLSESCKLEIMDNSKSFADVAGDHWAAEAVQFVASRELFTGGDSGFLPAGEMSRAMLFTVLARLDGQDTEAGSSWYSAAMDWAKEAGISDGIAPEANITRESLAVMLYRYAGSPEVDESRRDEVIAPYTDAGSVSDWATEAMLWAVDSGILQGSDSKLNPNGTATRAEVAVMLQRFISNMA